MNELDLFVEALNRTDPAKRAAFLDQACAGNPELRRRLEDLLAGHARSSSPLDRPPVVAAGVGATTEPPSTDATGEHRPDGATETVDHADLDATSASNPGAPAHPAIATGEHQPDGATGTFPRPDPNANLSIGLAPRAARVPTGEGIGTVIAGRYTLVEVIGEGGMGSVYRASQTEPVKRQVALKLIKTGMDSRGVLARFDAERQALAMMDHPNIARIYDGGLTPAGQPFFVMELVQGVPLTQYCDQKRLTVKARLELFVAVCQAVQHAHQKGIIHRDLKPNNVMVTEFDGQPTPKVIDFGVAKATEVKLTDLSFADVGAIVGTPAYMSPEQADPTSMDIDTRTDVYALGVILYELLVGSPPLEAKDFKRGAILEMLRMVREVDPPRPSTKLSTAEALPNIAVNRSIEPARLAKLLQGELDWVVMKALEKDRTRRYETANGFARDIQRYLADEVVEARPPSRVYRLKKFVKRNKIQVIAASLVFLTLVGGILGTSIGLYRADRAREAEAAQTKIAVDEKKKAEASEAVAQEKRQEADRNLAFAKKGNEILGSVFTGLDPEKNYADLGEFSKALTDNLKQAVRDLEGSAIGDPFEVAAMQIALGRSLVALGEFDLGVEVLQKARETREARLGPDHPDTLTSMINLASAYRVAGRLDLALPLYEQTLASMKATLGPDHPETISCMNNLSLSYKIAGKLDLALPLMQETLALVSAMRGPDDRVTLRVMNNLAGVYQDVGKWDQATPLLERTLALSRATLGPEHLDTLSAMNNLAAGYRDAGKMDLALPLIEQTLTLTRARLGPDHPETLRGMNNLAECYRDAKKLDLALPLFEQTLALRKAKLDPDHPDTLASMNNLAACYRDAGKMDLALPLFEQTLALMTAKFGPDHPSTLTLLNNLTVLYTEAGKQDLALPLMEQTLTLRKAKLGPDHPDTLLSMANLAAGYWSMKRLDRSVPLFEELVPLLEKKLGRDHPLTQTTVANLGINYKDAGRLQEAIPLLEEVHRTAKRNPTLRWVVTPLMDAYAKAGENAKLADLLQEQLAEARKALPKDSPQLAGMLAQIGMSLLQQKQWTEAEPLLRECLAIREKTQPDVWSTFNTQSLLGGALLGQKKYADAEPLLLAGYEGMKQREATIPDPGKPRLPEALDRLIELYTATDKPDEVEKWRAERTKYPEAAPPAP